MIFWKKAFLWTQTLIMYAHKNIFKYFKADWFWNTFFFLYFVTHTILEYCELFHQTIICLEYFPNDPFQNILKNILKIYLHANTRGTEFLVLIRVRILLRSRVLLKSLKKQLSNVWIIRFESLEYKTVFYIFFSNSRV